MKKIVLATIVLVSSSWAYSPYSSEGETLIGDQSQVTTIVNNPVSTAITLKSKNKTSSAAGDVITSGDVKLVNIPIAYKLSDNLMVVGAVPYLKVPGNSGLGDASIGVNYLKGKDASDMIAAEARLKIATGDETNGLGTGADSLLFAGTYSKAKGEYTVLATGSYTLNSIFSANVPTYTGETTYGDVINVSAGVSRECIFSKKVITSARISYMSQEADETTVFSHNNATTNIDLWLNWSSDKIVENVPLKWGVKIPLQAKTDNNNFTYDKEILFYISAAGFLK
jgi:hypothetical protein